jgi:hypothetical protein
MLRYYTFEPGSNAVTATTYATWSDFYEEDASSAFTFNVSFGTGQNACAESGSAPWSEDPIQLPGRLEAEFYDLGCNGYAYSDLDNINEGGQFRTDGVDVEIAYDDVQGYNVGWLRDGEWINYTVEVAESRAYALDLRVASAGNGSIMRIEVDGTDVTGPIAIDPTGTWQSWTTITVPDVFLDQGVHEFRLAIDDGDFNLNYIDVE